MNKIYRVVNDDVMSDYKTVFYVKDIGKIGNLSPVYRIWKCENGVMVEGDYYYPDICKKIYWDGDRGFYETPIDEMRVHEYEVLVPIPEHVLKMSKEDIESYILSYKCKRGMRFTHLEEISEEEIEKMRELCEDNHKTFKETLELLKGE